MLAPWQPISLRFSICPNSLEKHLRHCQPRVNVSVFRVMTACLSGNQTLKPAGRWLVPKDKSKGLLPALGRQAQVSPGHGPQASWHLPPLPNLPCPAVKTVLFQADLFPLGIGLTTLTSRRPPRPPGSRSQGLGEGGHQGWRKQRHPGCPHHPSGSPAPLVSATQSHSGQVPAQPSRTGRLHRAVHARVPPPTVLST